MLLSACYIRFSDNMIETYEDHGKEILNLAAEDIVIDHIPDYLSGNYDRAEYEATVRKLNLYPRYFDDVFYLYAYQLNGDGANATYLFDAKVDHDDPMELGDNYELEVYNDETREPWNRYSTSLGLAEYQSTDLGLSDIMKRADEAMYADKAAFKATYGNYR